MIEMNPETDERLSSFDYTGLALMGLVEGAGDCGRLP